jgi:lactate 2-monooxygenase
MGIENVLKCLLAEIDLTMVIDGYPRTRELTREA